MIRNRDIATAAAAELTLSHLTRALRATPATAELLEEALGPVFGIRRSAQIIRRVLSGQLNGICNLLRNSPLSQQSYARVVQLWKDALRLDLNSFPPDWETWRSLIENSDLDDHFPLPTWIPITQWCVDHSFSLPSTLARVTFRTLSRLVAVFRRIPSYTCFGAPRSWLLLTRRHLKRPSLLALPDARKLSPAPRKPQTSRPHVHLAGFLCHANGSACPVSLHPWAHRRS